MDRAGEDVPHVRQRSTTVRPKARVPGDTNRNHYHQGQHHPNLRCGCTDWLGADLSSASILHSGNTTTGPDRMETYGILCGSNSVARSVSFYIPTHLAIASMNIINNYDYQELRFLYQLYIHRDL